MLSISPGVHSGNGIVKKLRENNTCSTKKLILSHDCNNKGNTVSNNGVLVEFATLKNVLLNPNFDL
jgi:hypothetical protein